VRTANSAYSYDANDRLTQHTTSGTAPDVGTTTYAYDAAGNLTQKTSPQGTENYVYDDANRMVELIAANQEVTRYAYNHNGIRIKQARGATGSSPQAAHYLVDPNQAYAQVAEEHAQSGSAAKTLAALYTFGDDRISQYRPANGTTPATVRHYHADGLGSTRLLTDNAGVVTDRYYYEAFGELETAASLIASDNDFLYTGEQLDPNSGFYYLRARYMDPGRGRFTQKDEFEGHSSNPLTQNGYGYADFDPVLRRDPSGYAASVDVLIGTGAQGNVRTTQPIGARAAVNIARKAKIYNAYTYIMWPLHLYMYVEKIGVLAGLRYDVGNALGWGGMSRRNPFGVMPGGFVSSFPAERKELEGKGVKVAAFTFGQWMLWHSTVVGTEDKVCEKEITYSITPGLGTNCASWTAWATGKAILISRMPL
jgi:RHS repeat-associated protein